MIKIHMFQANYGDSFLMQISPDTEFETNIMIDCGFGYRNYILPKLKAILENGKKIDRFIITHYDADHIRGAISLFEENGKANDPQIVKIDQVWLNTFRHLQFYKKEKLLLKSDKRKIDAYCSSKKPKDNGRKEGVIGALQATTLGALILKNGYDWNSDADNNAISVDNIKQVDFGLGVVVQLLTPDNENLKLLEKSFLVDLARVGLKPIDNNLFDDAFEYYSQLEEKEKSIAKEGPISSGKNKITKEFIRDCVGHMEYSQDPSKANSSSIAFILNHGHKRVLFLGDAHGEDIVSAIKLIKEENEDYPLYFDAIKVSHHGSFHNNSSELYEYIDSGKFIISTNGEHPKHIHPDIETIACIINRDLPEGVEKRELILNYELDHLKEFNNEALENDFKYSIKVTGEISL